MKVRFLQKKDMHQRIAGRWLMFGTINNRKRRLTTALVLVRWHGVFKLLIRHCSRK
jgi:hypothetical protein